ncbi:type II CAAX endopeptidase family protein [Proteinivorax hydrogeniformans]|uniref:Type II CAAX endopeptidase family protein n=1 Tax=Proteinivorax hydrogeniformans TaxID=1826727 RepID=A0AAU8HVT1_9FIRM
MHKLLKPIHSSWMLLAAAVTFIIVSFLAGGLTNVYGSILLTQVIGILMPPVLFMFLKKYNIKQNFRLHSFNLKQFVLITFGIIAVYPVGVFLNAIFQYVLIGFEVDLPTSPIPNIVTSSHFLVAFMFIAVLPGICEEVLFRGFIMRGYEKFGAIKAIAISAVLFGMFHFTLTNLAGPIFLGAVIGYIVIATRSLFAGMYAHGLNNAIALTLIYITSNGGPVENEVVTQEMMLTALYILAATAMLCAIAAFFILRTLSDKSLDNIEKTHKDSGEAKLNVFALIPIGIFVILYLLAAG